MRTLHKLEASKDAQFTGNLHEAASLRAEEKLVLRGNRRRGGAGES